MYIYINIDLRFFLIRYPARISKWRWPHYNDYNVVRLLHLAHCFFVCLSAVSRFRSRRNGCRAGFSFPPNSSGIVPIIPSEIQINAYFLFCFAKLSLQLFIAKSLSSRKIYFVAVVEMVSMVTKQLLFYTHNKQVNKAN